MTNGYGYVIIETPLGAGIFVDGVQVGTVSAPISDKGSFSVDSSPRGAKIYLKKTAGYVYHGMTPQTLTLPAGQVPYLVKIEKDEYGAVFDLVYIPPGGTVSKIYHMERVTAAEPDTGKEPTATVTVRCSPPAQLWLYMEGAEGFISYGTTPQTLTLKATRGMWVAMTEAKAARAEGRITVTEGAKLDTEIARRAEVVRLAKIAYDEAHAARLEAEAVLSSFRSLYNQFLVSYQAFITTYNAAKAAYNAAAAAVAAGTEGAVLPDMTAIEAEKVAWDADVKYWGDMLKYYEERVKLLREFEDQMKDEWEQAKVMALAPYWMVTPGLLGTTWRLKITKDGYQDVIDQFTLEPAQIYTKDYALVKALDVTTPESLAPLIESTPPPQPPAMPFAHTWLYIVCFDPNIIVNAVWYDGSPPPIKSGGAFGKWHKRHYQSLGPIVCGHPNQPKKGPCSGKFLKVPPGTHNFYISVYKTGVYGHWQKRQSILGLKLHLAPGETRYVIAEYTTVDITTDPGMCPFGGTTGGDEATAAGTGLCGRPARSSFGTGGAGSTG